MGYGEGDATVGELVAAIRDGLAALADPAKAEPMRAYMKSTMAFRGVPSPARRAMQREVLAAHPLPDGGAWLATVMTLWREAAFREERYAAVDLFTGRPAARWRTPALVPVVEELLVGGAWWDLVDPVATHALGDLLRRFHAELRPVVLAWSGAGDMWLRRASIICQIGSKAATDTELLQACIGANTGQRDFFIRKAIGWALREHAKTDPAWVRACLRARWDELSPLSRREAAKHLGGATGMTSEEAL